MLEDLEFADDIVLPSPVQDNKAGRQLSKSRDEAECHKMQSAEQQEHLGATDISKKTKFSPFNSLVLPVWLYGCGTKKLTKTDEKRIDTFQTKCLRRILKIRWQHVPN